jgi:glutamate-1-semialdehyde 2,1-aminomutase
MTFDERYGSWAPRSRELFRHASEIIPGGAGSSARTAKFGWMPYPPFMARGAGSRITDADGHEYIDYLPHASLSRCSASWRCKDG